MKTSEALTNGSARLTRLLRVCTAALAVSLLTVLPSAARGDDVTPPAVPAAIAVPTGHTAFLQGHAVGTQGYICQPAGASFAWTFVKPQATLFDANDEQIITHFLSANPDESGTPRASWQDSHDTSHVWANKIASADHSSDPDVVEAGAIPWFLLQVVGKKAGPTGGDALTASTFIQRLNTSGGVAPATGCAQSTDVGNRALVPYTADYFFFKAN